jgi:hypothetical protein
MNQKLYTAPHCKIQYVEPAGGEPDKPFLVHFFSCIFFEGPVGKGSFLVWGQAEEKIRENTRRYCPGYVWQCCQVLSRLVRHFNKNTPLFSKNTPLIHILKNSATFPLFNVIFLMLTSKTKTEFFSNFNSFIMFACPNVFKTKFRYFSATFA